MMPSELLIAQHAGDALSTGFMLVFLGLILAYVPLQILALVKLQGGWRVAALVPLALIVAAAGVAVVMGFAT